MDTSAASISYFGSAQEMEIDWIMDSIANRFIKNNIAVVLGEFGSVDKNNESSRVALKIHYALQNKINCISGKCKGDS